MEKFRYLANGKLLISGEYLVMDGAAALACPLTFNQVMDITLTNDKRIYWIASDTEGKWFNAVFSLDKFNIERSSDHELAVRLQRLLLTASGINPFPFQGASISTNLNFNRFMGLGSSSTLISLVAELFGVNKYKLHCLVSEGSGYDIACTDFNHPIIYQKISPTEFLIKPINYCPPFADYIYFVWSGSKQNTNDEIVKYRNRSGRGPNIVDKITEITFKISEVKELSNFVRLIELHEDLISSVINRMPIKKERFSGFKGCVKSLGAWGGDFLMAATDEDFNYVKEYFGDKGCSTVYRFNDIVLNDKVIQNDTHIRS